MTHFQSSSDEIERFTEAAAGRLPVMLTGPTGCGKTQFVEHMAQQLGRPLITVTCHDDLSTADLVGRYIIEQGDVRWVDGPLTRAARLGAICYLDEVIEARRDSLAVLHSLADHRRSLYLERTGEVIQAPDTFMLVCSYNPRNRGSFKELRPSFRQRFVTLSFDYADAESEARIVAAEGGVALEVAARLVAYARSVREGTSHGLSEAPSTRLLVNAAILIAHGCTEHRAVEIAMVTPLSIGPAMEDSVRELVRASVLNGAK
jgi:nitric oxide reductase NorQ protein